MTRTGKAELVGATEKPVPPTSPGEWFTAARARAELRRLRGTWRDQRNSEYTITAGVDGANLDVATQRANGEWVNGGSSTRGLIHIDWNGELGRIVWGKGHPSDFYNIKTFEGRRVHWERSGNAAFFWDRVGADPEPPTQEKATPSPNFAAAKKTPKPDAWEDGPAPKPAAAPRPNAWGNCTEEATLTVERLFQGGKNSDTKTVDRSSQDTKSTTESETTTAPSTVSSDISFPDLPSRCKSPGASLASTESSLQLPKSPSASEVLHEVPPPPRKAPPTPSQFDKIEARRDAKVKKVAEITGVEMSIARDLLVSHCWNLEESVRAQARISFLEEKAAAPPPPPPRHEEKAEAPPPPPPRQPPSKEALEHSKGCLAGDLVFAHYIDEWLPATVEGYSADGLIQVMWADRSTSTMPDGRHVAKRGMKLKLKDEVIAEFYGNWYLGSVRKLLSKGMAQVLWKDDATVSDVNLRNIWQIPK